MEDEERQKKLEAGKAKLAEYRQRKAYANRQKKQKKKKRSETDDDPGGDGPGKGEAERELDQSVGEEVSGSGGKVGGRGEHDPPTTEFTFARTLRSGETVKRDQTYTIEPDSEVSTTAEDYSSEVNGFLEMTEIPMETSKEFIWEEVEQEEKGGRVQVMEEELTAKTLAVEELSRELEEYRAVFGTEGVQQLQDFEAALKQRDGIITQLTANLQQSRKEKDEVMREFLEMTEQSQKLHIQFQQLQAGETLRNTSHSSTAQDLLQAKQQLVQYQQQLEEMDGQVRGHQEMSEEQLLQISQLQHRLNEAEMVARRTEKSFTQRLNDKDLLLAEQDKILAEHVCSLMQLREELTHVGRGAEESFAQRVNEKDLLISEQTAIIQEHERTLTMLKVELAQVGRMTEETFAQKLNEKELLIAEQERVMSEHDSSLHQVKEELTASEKRLNVLNQQMTAKAQELESCKSDLDNCKRDLASTKGELASCRVELEGSKGELDSYRVELENGKGELASCRVELESCRGELSASRQKERMSSSEIQQLMGTVEDLQKRCHQGSLSECDTLQRIEEDSARRLDHLRTELDEMYGEQIVQMKQELCSQHSAALERVMEQHREELELLRAQQPAPRPSPEVVIELKSKIAELQQRLQESQALSEKARQELSQVAQEKLNLQAQVVDLIHDLRSARAKVEQSSQNIAIHENHQGEMQRLQETMNDLKAQLATAAESAEEIEAKHESETTNYKIKLEMMEREKDAVLDRMAESQEAELERLRTQLLFSHEEELILQREDLQRESQLNAENLLNEASIRHSRALEELRNAYEDKRDELLHQIIALKDDLNMALHSSKSEELVVQLKELQVEVEELRKGGEGRIRIEKEIQMLLKKNELLENQSKEREKSWDNKWKEQESEKRILMETNNAMKEEMESKIKSSLTENEQKQRQVVELQDEIEKQRKTFSFAEKNFEVNYQELKEEYMCLVEVKVQLEERILKETLVYESKLASLQSQIQELRENKETSKMEDKSKYNGGASIEKDTTELMEKLKVALTEKEELAMRLSDVIEQLTVTEGELDELEGELSQVRRENMEVIAQNENLEEELERERETLMERKGEIELQRQREEGGRAAPSQAKLQQRWQPVQSSAPACSIEDHHLQIESLQGEVEVLRSSLQAAEIERDRLRHTPEAWHQNQTLTLSAAPSQVSTVGEGPVERSSAVEPSASGSYRRKTPQRRGKKKRQSSTQTKERKEEVAERNKAGGATAAAEREAHARMESQVPLSSQQRTGEEDSTDGYHGDGERDCVGKQGKRVDGMECLADPVAKREEEEEDRDSETTEHVECRLQLEAQRISLSQMHAAQLELLREQTDARASTLEQELGRLKTTQDKDFTDDLKSSKYQNVVQVVSEECKQLIMSFAKLFGEEFLEYLHPSDVEDWKIHSFEKEETRDSRAVLQEAKEMYRDLQQVKQKIEQEHSRLLQLQSLLKADGNKIEEMQLMYDVLKHSSEEKIASLIRHIESSSTSTHKDLREPTVASSSSHTAEDIQKLRGDVQHQRAQLEECHRQEVERLRVYYQQQAKATEERYATELIVLQQHLNDVTGTKAQFSLSTAAHLGLRIKEEDAEELKLVEVDALLVGLDAEQRGPDKSMGLTAQLQMLRRALYHKYLQEVAALKEQHCAELTRLREERVQEKGEKVREEGEEDVRLQVKPDPEGVNGGVRSIEGPSTEDQGGQERRHQERVEEEIAKVIVQMSVEFAQQSELARITKSARETTSAMQTQSEVEGEEEEQQTPRISLTKWISLEEVQRRFAEEKERLEKELAERTAELHGIKEHLRRRGPGSEQKRGEEEGEEDEVRRKRAMGGTVSSQDGGDDSSCPDHQVITTERNLLRKANESLRQVLSDVLKTTAAAEETIGRHVEGLLVPPSSSQRSTWQRAAGEPFRPATGAARDVLTTESCQGSETGTDDVSVWSGETETDVGLEMSQQMTGSHNLLPGAQLQLEKEEYLMNISSRLQAAVEKLLEAITETTNQLEHAQVTQTELMRESFRHNQEIGDLLRLQEDLQERLGEEGRAREQLALELHRAEGLIDGYTGERAALEEQVRQKGELQLSLEQELQVTSSRLHELEQERLQMQEERDILSRQQDAMREHAGPRELRLVEAAVDAAPEADLLEETEKLMAEKVEVQRQAEKESLDLLHQVKTLEAELEEQVNRVIELEHARKTESGDLLQQIQALEKQLEKNRRFLDEQAIDREHERDVFQQEILKLEQQLKNSQKQQPGSEQRSREVDQLTQQLREKADWCSELLLASEQLQREAGERNEEIDKLEGRIRELEQALLASTEKVEDKRQHVSVSEPGDSSLEAQLQTEREALDRKEKEISNLEEQLEQFREELENKSEEVHQLHMQLEIQRKELSTQQQDLETKDSLLQVMEEKDREIALLNERMAKLQHTETAPDNKEIDARDELLRELESQVECMRSEQQRLKRNSEEELEQLNSVIDKLQEELANIERKQSSETDEELKGQLESQVRGPSKEEYDEMKQKMDLATQELDTIKAEHCALLERYRCLQESRLALADSEKELSDDMAMELQDALREKTAAFVVVQAQIQALEQSATSRVNELSLCVQELEACVAERDSELTRCRFLVERAQEDADDLQHKVRDLEDKLRERVAAALVSQAQLGAVQQQLHQSQESKGQRTKESGHQDSRGQMEVPNVGFAGMSRAAEIQGAKHGPTGKVVLLTEKLRELEVGLSGMQKDQELQKQLLSSSEEEVLEYEKRLVLLLDLLNQMRTTKPGGCQRTFPATETASSGGNEPAVSEILQELQKVRDEASATKEQLSSYRESSNKLQQELKAKEVAIAKLQEDLQRVSGGSEAKVSELHQELKGVKEEAAATKVELSSYRESCDELQELLQEREMTIAHLKGELYRASLEGDGAPTSKLLQELQEVRDEAAATKEHLNSFRECSEKLQTELQVRDLSIAQLQEELQQLRVALAKTTESPSPLSPVSQSQSPSLQQQQQAPPYHPKKKSVKPQNQHQGAKGKMAASAKDKPSFSRKNSAAANQKSCDKLSGQSSGLNGSQRPPHTDAGTQTETFSSQTSGQPRSVSEVEEMIGEYQEKIVQMQELHAAEILDMEARHIAESDALKRDTQILEEECKALKTVIEKLQRSHEAPSSRPERPAGSQFKDCYTSDSSSEWSQRTGYDLPNLQQEFRTTPEGTRKETDEALPDRIKNLLREVHQEGMQVLSLSVLPIPEGEADPASLHHAQGWPKEREALLATVESLKALITQIQTHSRETQTPGSADWRGELLGAVQQVFVRERSVLKSALYARLDQLDTSEHRLAEQDAHHRDAMGMLQTADRSSLLTEVRQLRAQLEQIQAQEPGRRGRSNQGCSSHSGVQPGVEHQRERGGVPEPHILQQADRALLEELKGELSQTKLELETTLKAQHKHLKELDTVRTEVSQKAAEVDTLADRLADEQKKARELQWAFEKEKCKSDKKEELEREELEDLKLALEEQQNHVAKLTSALSQERQSTSQLSLQAEQLHVQLESERARAQELSSALGREKELRHHSSSWRENPEGEVAERGEDEVVGGAMSSEGLLEGLQRELDEKHAQVVSLLDEVEAQKLAAVRREEELTSAAQRSCQNQEALREAKGQLESLGEQAQEAMEQLKREVQQVKRLEQEKERLQERVVQLGETREWERNGTQQQPENQNQAVWRGEPTDQTRDWVFQQKFGETLTVNPSTPSLTGTVGNLAPHHDPKHSDKVLGKLQLIAAKIQTMVSKGSGRLTTEVDSEGLSWLQTNIDEVITMLQQSAALPSVPESTTLLAGGQSSSLTERLLRQNAELTGFVSRLTEEKNDLRNQTLRLEDELRRYRHAGLGSGDSSRRGGVDKQQEAASVLFSSEREAWTRERSRLEKGLRLAQAEVTRLRGEIRTESLRDMNGPESDNATLKKMYGKYLRSESFRKALIYQKKYLLLLLGGFQECEEATLSIIARMGSRPSHCSLESLTQPRRGLTRFRSAVRVSIALSRMHFLVKRWHKATGISSITSVNVNRNGLGQSPGNEVRTDSPYLQPGSVEVYGERRGAIRGRTGRDSPRSALSSAQHRFHMAGDPGPLTCSHLQNYDPDRALTDYISRLEALQRRLGSVQSGSSSYAQLHFGIKR